MKNENELEAIIDARVKKYIDADKRIPRLYTAIVKAVGGSRVSCVLAGYSDVMTFSNKCSATLSAGDAVYIMTTGGNELTGAMVVYKLGA